jgi:hypothetical protein
MELASEKEGAHDISQSHANYYHNVEGALPSHLLEDLRHVSRK